MPEQKSGMIGKAPVDKFSEGAIAADPNEDNNKSKARGDDSKKQGSALKAIGGAKAAHGVGMIAKLLALSKMLTGAATTALASAGGFLANTLGLALKVLNTAWGAITSVASGIAGFFAGAGAAVGSALGFGALGTTIATAIIAVTVSGSVLFFSVGTVLVATNQTSLREGNLIATDCNKDVKSARAADSVDASEAQMQNAEVIYSVLATYGLDKNQVAGVLGNFSAESGIDTTSVEGISDERYSVTGPRKSAALSDLDAYTRGPLSRQYGGFTGSGGPVKNPGGYTAKDGKMYPGIGLAQWTAGNAKALMDVARANNMEWHTADFQIAYMIAKGDSPTGYKDFWARYKSDTAGASPRECGRYFSQHFEGNTQNAMEKRLGLAESWAGKLPSMNVDTAKARSLLDLATNMGLKATDAGTHKALTKCKSSQKYDNSSAALAASSYAWDTADQAKGNDGTALYRRVHDNIWGNGLIYQSCDFGVATAIRWSGTDETYPSSDCPTQLSYLQTSSKWKKVGYLTKISPSELQPGDVCIHKSHTMIYIGKEAMIKYHPNNTGLSVSASYCERSPGADSSVEGYQQNADPRGDYIVFRCVKPDKGSKYKDAGAGAK